MSYERPSNENSLFNRVSTALCERKKPTKEVFSAIDWQPQCVVTKQCSRYQAISSDYEKNGMNLDRGHLSPDNINNQDREKQFGTYTITNIAPQYASFNRGKWRIIECITKETILDWAPKEPAYVMAGTHGVIYDSENKRLLSMNGVRFMKK